MMREFFGGLIIYWNSWPPWSPDVSLSLGVYEREQAQKQPAHTMEELEQSTELYISNVTVETLHWVESNMGKR